MKIEHLMNQSDVMKLRKNNIPFKVKKRKHSNFVDILVDAIHTQKICDILENEESEEV